MYDDLLKITGGGVIVIKKNSKEHVIMEPTPLIILASDLFFGGGVYVNEVLNNRLFVVRFINKVPKAAADSPFSFNGRLREEEANIILYCNKLLFRLKGGNIKVLSYKISNQKIIQLINFE